MQRPYTHKRHREGRLASPLLNLAAAVAFVLLAPGVVSADRWQTLTFTQDIKHDLEELSQFCLLHDVTSTDVLWANNCTVQDLVPGKQIYLPASQVDMLSIWQNQGAWKPKALVKTTSSAAAERARGSATGGAAPQAAKSTPAATAQAVQPTRTPIPAPRVSTPQPQQARANAEPKGAAPTPAPQNPIKVQEDTPIVLISPEGDSLSGPMRLVVSGDRVMIVRLPRNAAPRDPALSFSFPPSLLPPFPPERKGDNSPRLTSSKMLWPVDGSVSSPFGRRGSRRHDGVDIPMPPGTPIRAARDGVVALTGTNTTPGFRGYGNFVLIDHGQNLKTLYAHCSKVNVTKGQRIRQGEIIANVGRTGRATTDHVHFEVRVKDKAVDPIPYLQKVQVASNKR